MFKMFTFTINDNGKTENFDLSITMIMYLCSILCSSDIIAAITIVKFED